MALSRTTRVNLLIGTGHFLSHFYVLCLPPLFLAWQGAFGVSFAQLGLSVMLMSGTTALLQTPVGFLVDRHGARVFLVGGALLMCLSMAAMGLATAFWQILVLATLSGVGNSAFIRPTTRSSPGRWTRIEWGGRSPCTRFPAILGFPPARR